MPWVRFVQPFDWSVPEIPGSTIAYKAGEVFNVRQATAAAAGDRALPATRAEIAEVRGHALR